MFIIIIMWLLGPIYKYRARGVGSDGLNEHGVWQKKTLHIIWDCLSRRYLYNMETFFLAVVSEGSVSTHEVQTGRRWAGPGEGRLIFRLLPAQTFPIAPPAALNSRCSFLIAREIWDTISRIRTCMYFWFSNAKTQISLQQKNYIIFVIISAIIHPLTYI